MSRVLRGLFAAFVLLIALPLAARTLDVPQGRPLFRLDVPDDWNLVSEGATQVTLMAPDTYAFMVSRASALESRESAEARLQELAAQFADGFPPGEVRIEKVVASTNRNGVAILTLDAVRTTGRRVRNHVVEVAPGQYWLVETLGSMEFDVDAQAAGDRAIESLQLVAATRGQ